MIIPLVIGLALLAAFGLMASSKKSGTPELPPKGGKYDVEIGPVTIEPASPLDELPGGDPAGAVSPGGASPGVDVIPPGSLPPAASPKPAPSMPTTVVRPTLSRAAGSSGSYVVEWQKIIGVTADGAFGSDTEKKTKAWQTARGLVDPTTKVASGIVGPKSWSSALGVTVVSPPPGIAAPVGTGSGAVSVAKDGSIDDAFDELVARAIASGNIQLLTDLATQAKARGLNAVYNSIQEEIARIVGSVPILTSGPPAVPKVAPVTLPTGRAMLSWAAGSKGPDVMEWQRLIGAKIDGIFGENTHKATMAWQKARGLTVDGIVGPNTWKAAYAAMPELATAPRPAVLVTAPTSRPELSWAARSNGPHVVEWQKLIGITADGAFGENTHKATMAWQKARGLKVDGIVGPDTWKAAYAGMPALAVTPVITPVAAPVVLRTTQPTTPKPVAVPTESDKRTAARELTAYLQSIGGLAGRPTANRSMIAAWLARLGVPDPTGMYGRQGASAVLLEGLVPVVPFHWPKAPNTQSAKNEFTKLIRDYAAADPQRASQWNALISDIARS
jgi:peptidoglycan hydrolase-like protein with peptidoglycan-binding domain